MLYWTILWRYISLFISERFTVYVRPMHRQQILVQCDRNPTRKMVYIYPLRKRFIISTDWNLKWVNRKQLFQTFLGNFIRKGLYTKWQLCTSNIAHFRPFKSCSWNNWFFFQFFMGQTIADPAGIENTYFIYMHRSSKSLSYRNDTVPNSWFRILSMAV